MTDVLILAISRSQLLLYLAAVLATFFIIHYNRRKPKMPTKNQLLEAIAEYTRAEIELNSTQPGQERREALYCTWSAWNELEKLLAEATEGLKENNDAS